MREGTDLVYEQALPPEMELSAEWKLSNDALGKDFPCRYGFRIEFPAKDRDCHVTLE